MVQVNAKIEINLMLEPSIVKIQHGLKKTPCHFDQSPIRNHEVDDLK
jgi:hypothetical protein